MKSVVAPWDGLPLGGGLWVALCCWGCGDGGVRSLARMAAGHPSQGGRGDSLSPCCGQHYQGCVATGLPCKAELVASGAVHEPIGGDVHQELVDAHEVHPKDGEGHLCSQEGPLEGGAAEVQPSFFLSQAPNREAVGASESGLGGWWILGTVRHQAK